MSPQIDIEARSFGNRFELPPTRFGEGHIPREATSPREYDHHLYDEPERQEVLATLNAAERRTGQIAVADTVAVVPRLETL